MIHDMERSALNNVTRARSTSLANSSATAARIAQFCRYAMKLAAITLTLAFATSCTRSKGGSGVATAERDRIASIAKQAVAANDTWADRATYEVRRNGRGWSVTVWRIEGRDFLGRSQFTPGGFRDIDIDEHGKVTSYDRGY